jgi:hypothetical protein
MYNELRAQPARAWQNPHSETNRAAASALST